MRSRNYEQAYIIKEQFCVDSRVLLIRVWPFFINIRASIFTFYDCCTYFQSINKIVQSFFSVTFETSRRTFFAPLNCVYGILYPKTILFLEYITSVYILTQKHT